MLRRFFPFVLLLVMLLALAPRSAAIEEDTPIAASRVGLFVGPTLHGNSSVQTPDAAPFPVPCPFPGEGR